MHLTIFLFASFVAVEIIPLCFSPALFYIVYTAETLIEF